VQNSSTMEFAIFLKILQLGEFDVARKLMKYSLRPKLLECFKKSQ
jgi:hypothetical protein